MLRSETAFAVGADDAAQTVVYEGAGSGFSDTAVVNGTTYYYTLFSRNAVGEWGPGAQLTAVPKIPTALTLDASASTVNVNKNVVLTAEYDEAGVPAKAPAAVTVWSNASGTWAQVGTAAYSTTQKVYGYRTRVTKSTTFQFRTPGDAVRAGATSNPKSVAAKTTVRSRPPRVR